MFWQYPSSALDALVLAGWITTALYLYRCRRRLQRALCDPVTGLWTRAAWYPRARARLGPGSTIGLLDVDGLKPVNDTRGHTAGDQVLRTIATRLASELGEQAIVGRLGGDELAFLLPTTPSARRLDALVAELTRPIPLADADPARVGASLGLAPTSRCRRSRPHTLSAALRAADTAMYRAKAHPHYTWLWHRPDEAVPTTPRTSRARSRSNPASGRQDFPCLRQG